MLPLTFDLAKMRSHCLNPKRPSNTRGTQRPACQLKPHLLITLTTRSHFLHLSFYCTPLQDGRDKCEQEHNNCTTVSVLKGVPFFQVISKGSLVSSQHWKLLSAIYLSFSLGESAPSSSSSLSSFAPVSRCRAKSSKMMSSSFVSNSMRFVSMGASFSGASL